MLVQLQNVAFTTHMEQIRMQSWWKKKAKRERKLAEKRAKRQAKEGSKKKVDVEKSLDISKPITLDFLTNPDKKWIRKKKLLTLNWL